MYTTIFVLFSLVSICFTYCIYFKIVSIHYNYVGLFALVITAAILSTSTMSSVTELGITIPTFFESLLYIIVTILSCIVLWILAKWILKLKPNVLNIHKKWVEHMLFYIIVSSPIQEFLFRSFVYFSLVKMHVLHLLTMVAISSVLFTIAHIIFKDRLFLVGALTSGVIWSVLYFYYPNLLLVSLSHAVVGVFAFLLGFIKKETFTIRILPHKVVGV